MSDENQEIIADIVAEIRGAKTEFPFVYLMGEPDTQEVIDAKTKEIIEPRKINIRRVTVNELADRIEAAAKREKAQLGNAAAMREALVEVRNKLPYFLQYMRLRRTDDDGGYYDRLLATINAALSAPARNCDVGTAEEQAKRFEEFCNSRTSCAKCTVHDQWDHFFNDCGLKKVSCGLIFAQMPYLNE